MFCVSNVIYLGTVNSAYNNILMVIEAGQPFFTIFLINIMHARDVN